MPAAPSPRPRKNKIGSGLQGGGSNLVPEGRRVRRGPSATAGTSEIRLCDLPVPTGFLTPDTELGGPRSAPVLAGAKAGCSPLAARPSPPRGRGDGARGQLPWPLLAPGPAPPRSVSLRSSLPVESCAVPRSPARASVGAQVAGGAQGRVVGCPRRRGCRRRGAGRRPPEPGRPRGSPPRHTRPRATLSSRGGQRLCRHCRVPGP